MRWVFNSLVPYIMAGAIAIVWFFIITVLRDMWPHRDSWKWSK